MKILTVLTLTFGSMWLSAAVADEPDSTPTVRADVVLVVASDDDPAADKTTEKKKDDAKKDDADKPKKEARDRQNDARDSSRKGSGSADAETDGKPRKKVQGKIILQGPGWHKEFDLGQEMTLDRLLSLSLPLAEKGLRARADNSEPRYMLGIAFGNVSEALKVHLKLQQDALMVQDVVKGLPAAEAGIQKYDIILKVNDRVADKLEVLTEEVEKSQGKPLTLSGLRAGEPFSVSVTPKKLSPKDVAELTGRPFEDGDALWPPEQRRRWILAPGIRLDDDAQVEAIEKMIEEVRKAVRERAADDADHAANRNRSSGKPGADRLQNDVRRQLQRLENRIKELTARLEKIEKNRSGDQKDRDPSK